MRFMADSGGELFVGIEAERDEDVTASAVVSTAEAAHHVGDIAVLEVMLFGPGFEGQPLLTQAVFDLVCLLFGHGGLRVGVRCVAVLCCVNAS